MGFDLGLIIAFALAATATLSDLLGIPKKLRGWVAVVLIVGLYMVNQWLYSPNFDWKAALMEGITAGLASVGIHSSAKNTIEQWTGTSSKNTNTKKQDSQSAV
ncbi:hypothetical protein [Brevibacillus choshinensis]|uniref:hypothetical protein n=1 Tax=Brevibacillus choshinensis TaxID=54911 RepID=UPI002E1A1EF1|nr:hypothetical protein [Brevibacillus choshinensis]MED4752716.1 hypothetical protein [Brevibacillus choshinensis]MED4782672.1 hypothetical protein [Brevibacillus choshinensis]